MAVMWIKYKKKKEFLFLTVLCFIETLLSLTTCACDVQVSGLLSQVRVIPSPPNGTGHQESSIVCSWQIRRTSLKHLSEQPESMPRVPWRPEEVSVIHLEWWALLCLLHWGVALARERKWLRLVYCQQLRWTTDSALFTVSWSFPTKPLTSPRPWTVSLENNLSPHVYLGANWVHFPPCVLKLAN